VPVSVATVLVGSVIAIVSAVAAAGSPDTLIASEALESVQIHLASTQVPMVGFAGLIFGVVWIYDKVG